MGDDDIWEQAENQLKQALDKFGKPWKENPKDGAFYGPKIDIKLFDALNRAHQCGTIQLDFQAPLRFNLYYRTDHEELKSEDSVDDHMSQHSVKDFFDFPPDEMDSEPFRWEEHSLKPGYARPVIIHRAILGSVERFYSILLEQTAGKWPLWLSPRQVLVVPISKNNLDYAVKVEKRLKIEGIQVAVDSSDNTMAKKVLNAEKNQWNYILTCGKDEETLGMVDVRARGGEQLGKIRITDFIQKIKNEVPPKSRVEEEFLNGTW